MKLEERNGLRILTPDTAHLLQRKGDDNNFSEIVYLGKNDSVDNYSEISEEKARSILAEKEIHQERLDQLNTDTHKC